MLKKYQGIITSKSAGIKTWFSLIKKAPDFRMKSGAGSKSEGPLMATAIF